MESSSNKTKKLFVYHPNLCEILRTEKVYDTSINSTLR